MKFGSYVISSSHGHTGRVTGIRYMGLKDQEWLDGLTIRPTQEQLVEPWVDILCQDGGAVIVPMNTVTVVEEFALNNPYEDETFINKELTL